MQVKHYVLLGPIHVLQSLWQTEHSLLLVLLYVPSEHYDTHIKVEKFRNVELLQDKQLLLFGPEQVVQLKSQFKHYL